MESGVKNVYDSFLSRLEIFRNLEAEDIHTLSEYCRKESFQPGDIIFQEGAIADSFYIILDGIVEVWKDYEKINPSLLATHGPGHFFGEMALIDSLPRSATLLARDKTDTLCISRDDFRKLISTNSSIALSIMTSISFMVRKSNESFVEDLRKRNIQLERANVELKNAQKELVRSERLSALGKFSSLVLHDIKNPIAVMKALTELMRHHAQEGEAVEPDIKRLQNELQRMERLTQDFLDYSRGDIRLSLGVCSVETLFNLVNENFSQRLEREGIELSIENSIKKPVLLDQDRFLRVLLNLVDNARKACSRACRIRIGAMYETNSILFFVEDNGEGMSDTIAARIFDPFYSASGKGGTGLGMLIVKNIVEAHQGSVKLESEPGKGTKVSIFIPVSA